MMRAIRRLDCVGCESLCWIVVIVRELVPDWPAGLRVMQVSELVPDWPCDAGIRLASWLVVSVIRACSRH